MLTDVTGGAALGTGSTARGRAAGSVGGRARPQVKVASSSKGKVLHQANYGHSSTNVEYYLPPRAIGLVAQNQSALLGDRLVRRAGACYTSCPALYVPGEIGGRDARNGGHSVGEPHENTCILWRNVQVIATIACACRHAVVHVSEW